MDEVETAIVLCYELSSLESDTVWLSCPSSKVVLGPLNSMPTKHKIRSMTLHAFAI